MSDFTTTTLTVAAAAQILSIAALLIGARLIGSPRLARLGELLHRRKMAALEHGWPMKVLGRALEERDASTIRLIVTSLIASKSASCFAVGLVALPWLPFASLLVPSIVTAHDPQNPTLQRWARHVSTWQVTSHVLAAAPGFALYWHGLLGGRGTRALFAEHAVLIAAFLAASIVSALIAGRVETEGLLDHWMPATPA
jgi:hypothetical protein